MVILVIASSIGGFRPNLDALWAFLLGAVILMLFGTALALLFSAGNVFFRDFENIVSTVTIFTHWAVPMIYPWSKIAKSGAPEWFKELYLANPLSEAVILMQRAFWYPTCGDSTELACQPEYAFPDHLFTRGIVMVVVGIAFLAFSQWMFTRLEGKFAERLSS